MMCVTVIMFSCKIIILQQLSYFVCGDKGRDVNFLDCLVTKIPVYESMRILLGNNLNQYMSEKLLIDKLYKQISVCMMDATYFL